MGVILLPIKKQKVFRASITSFDVMRGIFVDYQSVRCGVIPLKVLHQFSCFGVILWGVLHQSKQIDIQMVGILKPAKV